MNRRIIPTAATGAILLTLFAILAACDTGEPATVAGPGSAADAPLRSDNDAYTQYIVRQAIDMYESDGLDATIDYYNTQESVDGQWYTFIFDSDDLMLAHAANPALVNRPASEAVGPNGYPAGDAIAAVADEAGSWFTYTFLNPQTGAPEMKRSWAVRHDGLLFGSGWYEPATPKSDPAAYTQSFVRRAIALYDAVGAEGAAAYYNTPESVDGQWYAFIFSRDDMMLAHAANPDLVGRPVSAAVGPNGYPAGDAIAAAADDDGEWFTYSFLNPQTGAPETKHSWAVRHDGLLFGSGWYEAGTPKSDAPEYTKEFVRQAVALYDAVGRDATVDYYNAEESVDGAWYVFIIGEDGRTMAHFNPMFIGRDPDQRVDSTGYFYGDDLLGATESGSWVSYVLTNPELGTERRKHTWAVSHDGLIFASGWYE